MPASWGEIAWRGPEQMGVSAQQTKIHVAIAAWQWPAYFGDEARTKGIKLTVSDWRRPAPNTAPVKAKAAGLTRKLSTLVLDGSDFTQIYGGEAVYHDGKVIGRVRSGGYGYTLKKCILYAYLPKDLAKAGTRLEVDLIEGRRTAEVTATVLFDPKGERLRA